METIEKRRKKHSVGVFVEPRNKNEKGIKAFIQRMGSYLSGMVMPNIGAFIACGIITALFIEDGWLPNAELVTLVEPMLYYLLPLLIAYTGGDKVYGQRGAVVGSIATLGVIVGSGVPMFIGAMVLGPLGAYSMKKFDNFFKDKINPAFKMLFINFSSGIIGFLLAILAFYAVGPFVTSLIGLLASGVESVVTAGLLPLANIFIEPAKVLFLNTAINHGLLTPLGIEQAAEAGGMAGTLTNVFMNSGLVAAASPGSILAILAMVPKGNYLGVILGITVATIVSFLVSALILKMDKSTEKSEIVEEINLQEVP